MLKIKKILAGPLLLLSTLIIMEIVARIGSATVFKKPLEKADLRTKLEHIYTPPTLPQKSPETLRVFAFGGSTAAGIPLPKTGFVSQLDYQLHHIFREKKNVEVHNFGVPGFNSTMIRYLLTGTLSSEPDLVIVYSGSNEFVYSSIDTIFLDRAIGNLRDRSTLFRILIYLSQQPWNKKTKVTEEPISRKRLPYRVLKPYYDLKLNILKDNMEKIILLAKTQHIPIIFITSASNVSDWPPVKSAVTFQLPNKYPDSPYLFYLRGKIAEKNADTATAKVFFEKAKEYDFIPFRATEEINHFIRSLGNGKSVWVVDAEGLLDTASETGYTGYDTFFDNVHLNAHGSFLVSKAILELIRQEGIVKPQWWKTALPPYSEQQILTRIKPTEQETAEAYLLTAAYCLKNPFFNFECTDKYLTEAEKLTPSEWRIPAMRGIMAYLNQDRETGDKFLYLARQQYGGPIQQQDFTKVPYLFHFQTN